MCEDELDDFAVGFFDFQFDLVAPAVEDALWNDGEEGDDEAGCGSDHGFGNTIRDHAAATGATGVRHACEGGDHTCDGSGHSE